MAKQKRELAIVKFPKDGKYHFIGSTYEQEVHELGVKGFDNYQDARDVLKKYGYKVFDDPFKS